ncbi:unnamed protein product [Orchesella dallaii]|uniref:Uncharacterized protein n=1 Tax=Orchesella dallaii TaxID=48710 RepID=A0ABP1RMX3_9HEXA
MAFEAIEVIDLTSDTEDIEVISVSSGSITEELEQVDSDNLPATEVNVNQQLQEEDENQVYNKFVDTDDHGGAYSGFIRIDKSGKYIPFVLSIFAQETDEQHGTSTGMMAATYQQAVEDWIQGEKQEGPRAIPDAAAGCDNSQATFDESQIMEIVVFTSQNGGGSTSPAEKEVLGQLEAHDCLPESSSLDSDLGRDDGESKEVPSKPQEKEKMVPVCPSTVEYQGKMVQIGNVSIKIPKCDSSPETFRKLKFGEADRQNGTLDASPRPIAAAFHRQINYSVNSR